jgi:Na+/proline symporter
MDKDLIVSVIVGYFAVLIGIMYFTSKGATNDTFFLGERKSPWYLVAFGMIGASLSGITFISVPGKVGGSGFTYMHVVFGYLVGYFIVAYVLLPIYYRMNLTSIYEYLKSRFGNWSYKTGAGFFLVSRVIGASIRLLLVATVLQEVLLNEYEVPFFVTVTISVALIWVYTNKGGIKTILWTDALQTGFMLLAVAATVWILYSQIDWRGTKGLLSTLEETGMSKMFNFDNVLSGGYFWKSFIGGMFLTIGMTGLDQDMMQKNLTCKTVKDSQKNMVSMAIMLVVVNFVFVVLGGLMFLYSAQEGVGADLIASGKTDMLFSAIAMSPKTGTFVGVLFLLGLIAAAYSSADSALTSLTTSFSIDFLDIKSKPLEMQEKLRKQVHIVMSFVVIGAVLIIDASFDTSAIWTLISLAGPLIGLFFFGILTKRNLKDKLVLPISILTALIMIYMWLYSSGGKLVEEGAPGILGDYSFGADLIFWNALLSFSLLFVISTKGKEGEMNLEILDEETT